MPLLWSKMMKLNMSPFTRVADARAAALHAKMNMIGGIKLFLAHPNAFSRASYGATLLRFAVAKQDDKEKVFHAGRQNDGRGALSQSCSCAVPWGTLATAAMIVKYSGPKYSPSNGKLALLRPRLSASIGPLSDRLRHCPSRVLLSNQNT